MKIGMTYDLRDEYLRQGYEEALTAEFDSQQTIQALEETLRSLGYLTDRIGHVRNLVARLVAGERWDLVFNIAEGVYGFGREAQVPALLDAFHIPYTFSDPLVLALTLHKGMTKRIVRDLGIPTPAFAVVETLADLEQVQLPWPLFAKPVAGGSSMGVCPGSKVQGREKLASVCLKLWKNFRQPVLLETFLPGREFTVGIAGTAQKARVLGVLEVLLRGEAEPEVYSYVNKIEYESRVRYQLVDDDAAGRAADAALRAWKGLGCRDAGRVDLRSDAQGTVNFLEVNPLAGLNPIHSDLPILCKLKGITYPQLIEMIMASASERLRTDRKQVEGNPHGAREG